MNKDKTVKGQSAFSFEVAPELVQEDFFISAANEHAVALINQWPEWQGGIALLYGPKASGKTHLATIWAQKSDAVFLDDKTLYRIPASELVAKNCHYVVENIEHIHDETALFHLFNAVRGQGLSLLFTAQAHPTRLGVRLPDLRSRLQSIPMAELELPDETLLRLLLIKHFSDHQLRVAPEVADFLALRMERSFSAVAKVVEQLDRLALNQKRNITIPFVKEVASRIEGLAPTA